MSVCVSVSVQLLLISEVLCAIAHCCHLLVANAQAAIIFHASHETRRKAAFYLVLAAFRFVKAQQRPHARRCYLQVCFGYMYALPRGALA